MSNLMLSKTNNDVIYLRSLVQIPLGPNPLFAGSPSFWHSNPLRQLPYISHGPPHVSPNPFLQTMQHPQESHSKPPKLQSALI